MLIALADAVVSELNAGSWGLAFTAARALRPRLKLEDLGALRVTVIPRGMTMAALTRGSAIRTQTVEISVMQRVSSAVPATEEAAVEALVALMEELANAFKPPYVVDGAGHAVVTDVALAADKPFVEEHLDEAGLFNGSLVLTFREAAL